MEKIILADYYIFFAKEFQSNVPPYVKLANTKWIYESILLNSLMDHNKKCYLTNYN